MKKTAAAALALAAAALAASGCRRADFRAFTVEIPGMTAANTNEIASAVLFYDGVDAASLAFDLEKKTLSMKFDSLKVAQTNIRMAIEDKGIAVAYPAKSVPVAGYINSRDAEVEGGARSP